MGSPPLAGLKVLDLTRLLPGGYATLLLADLGADVVKVEEPGRGDYIRWTPPMVGDTSAGHVALNRNKRSLSLNLKSARGRDLLMDLAPRFDVLVESFRPGVMDRLGVGWESLHARNPRLIYCAITGYGQDGPRALEAGHDLDYMAYAGALGMTGEEGERPVIPGLQIGDLGGGGMAAVVAILAALNGRERTGEGEFCDIAMSDGIASWLTIHAAAYHATGELPQRGLMPLSGAYPCYRVYAAADGWMAVGALEPQFWSEVCRLLERPDLSDDAYAVGDRRAEVIAELDALFSTRTRAEWMEVFAGRDACVAPVNDFAEAMEDPQLRHRGMLVGGEVEGRTWTHLGNPIKLRSAGAGQSVQSPPGLGEHTDQVLAEIGLTRADIAALRADGVV